MQPGFRFPPFLATMACALAAAAAEPQAQKGPATEPQGQKAPAAEPQGQKNAGPWLLAPFAAETQGEENPAASNTLAALYAEQGRQAEARAVLRKIIENTRVSDLNEGDWYLVGRIAEGDGLSRSALLAYQHVKPAKIKAKVSIDALTRKRLDALAAAGVK